MVVSGGQGGDSTIHIHVSILPHEHIGFFLSIAAVFKFRCKPVGICFGLLQQFSKPAGLNFLRNSNNSPVCFIWLPTCARWFCNDEPMQFTTGSFCHGSQAGELAFVQPPKHRLGDKRAKGVALPASRSHPCSCHQLPLQHGADVLLGAVLHS